MKKKEFKKTLLQKFISSTTFRDRNTNPRLEGIVATLSDIVERESSFENLPKAIHKLHEFHRMAIDRSKVNSDDELEVEATIMTVCLSMMLLDKHITMGFKND